MKSIITLSFIIISSICFSQNVDTLKNALQIQPIVTNVMKGDTAYQLLWRVVVDRGKTNDGYCYVTMHDRLGNKIQDFSLTIPAATMNLWLDDSVIDDFILTKYKLSIRK